MAHQIDLTSIGRASYASTQQEWHFFETKHNILVPGATVEQWQEAAGMNYEVKRARVRYATAHGQDSAEYKTMEDKIVLFRSDTGAPLGIVSEGYKVVQPREVLEFFRDWADANGLTIESAGVLFGGKRYFATAKITNAVIDSVDGNKDKIIPYALLSTSADGSTRTEGRWTKVRTVCNNTLTAAVNESAAIYSMSHRSHFRADEARKTIEDAQKEFGAFMDKARELAGVRMSQKQAEDFTRLLTQKSNVKEAESIVMDGDKVKDSYGYRKIMELFEGAGKGAMMETSRGTAWGWLNAVTEFVDHHTRARTEDARIANAQWGAGDTMKNKAFEMLLTM